MATDAGWTERPGAIRVADLLMGEYVDARRSAGWDARRATASGRSRCSTTEPGPLVAEPDHPIRVTAELPATGVHRGAPAGSSSTSDRTWSAGCG